MCVPAVEPAPSNKIGDMIFATVYETNSIPIASKLHVFRSQSIISLEDPARPCIKVLAKNEF